MTKKKRKTKKEMHHCRFWPMSDVCGCMAKPIQYCKVKIIIIIKLKTKQKKRIIRKYYEQLNANKTGLWTICLKGMTYEKISKMK